ncbi:hypothetical protein CROQUDRAFT_104783 [Cronartium quercuum f. sp. fusiforme G11]|uniref:Uncharacterized protein n=1 Tax=Cronartium quercuum f. sp. fusiforme G11 TaxID=708437 RepID=A0A9P6TGJ7_9BASI|nr:hypothetical protein CROQUDRAFT_104783 [Cronartium quercuum f. sp. fusiforme G11]
MTSNLHQPFKNSLASNKPQQIITKTYALARRTIRSPTQNTSLSQTSKTLEDDNKVNIKNLKKDFKSNLIKPPSPKVLRLRKTLKNEKKLNHDFKNEKNKLIDKSNLQKINPIKNEKNKLIDKAKLQKSNPIQKKKKSLLTTTTRTNNNNNKPITRSQSNKLNVYEDEIENNHIIDSSLFLENSADLNYNPKLPKLMQEGLIGFNKNDKHKIEQDLNSISPITKEKHNPVKSCHKRLIEFENESNDKIKRKKKNKKGDNNNNNKENKLKSKNKYQKNKKNDDKENEIQVDNQKMKINDNHHHNQNQNIFSKGTIIHKTIVKPDDDDDSDDPMRI